MDANNHVITALLNGLLLRKQGDTLPVEPESTPFNLAYLRNAPGREQEPEVTAEAQVVPPAYARTA